MPTSVQQSAGGEMSAKFLGSSARPEIAVAIGKANYAVRVGDVEILWVGTGRVEGNPKWLLQRVGGEEFLHLSTAIAVLVAQNFDLIGATFDHEDIAVWRSQEITRIAQATRVFFDAKSERHSKLRSGRTRDNVGIVIGRAAFV